MYIMRSPKSPMNVSMRISFFFSEREICNQDVCTYIYKTHLRYVPLD